MYRACIFDLDGTLANTLDSIVYFANTALERCGWHPIEADKYRYLVGNGADTLMRGMLQTVSSSYTEEDVQRLRQVYDALYASNCTYLVTDYPGIAELIGSLRVLGVRLAVLSNKPHDMTTEIIHKIFPPHTFDLCYGQREGVERKPSPQGALLIAHELGVEPPECLYIGDTNVDMQTGSAAKMDTIGVLWGFRDRKELEENHACHIAGHPNQILELIARTMR